MSNSLRTASILKGTPYVSKRFQLSGNGAYSLRILIASNQIQFLIADDQSTVLYLHPFELNNASQSFFDANILSEILDEKELPQVEFSGVSACVFTIPFELIPTTLNQQPALIDYDHSGVKNGQGHPEILFDDLTSFQVNLAYANPKTLINLLNSRFKSISSMHVVSAHLKQIALQDESQSMHAILLSGHLLLICRRGKQLLLANSFRIKSSEDFIYYLMAAYHSLKLDPDETPLVLFGEIIRDSSIFLAANKYIRYVKLGKAPAYWRFEDDYPFPLHFYSSLLAL